MITTRDANGDDLARIVEIYNLSIPGGRATADTSPVTVDSRREWFSQFDSTKRPIWVAEEDGRIVGCIYVSSFYGGRPAYDKTAEVSLYLAPEAQGRALGSSLMRQMIDACPDLGITTLVGMHFDHNEATRHLNARFGFKKLGHLPEIAVVCDQLVGLEISILRIPEASET